MLTHPVFARSVVPIFHRAAALPDDQRRRVAKRLSKRSGLSYQSVLMGLRSGDEPTWLSKVWRAGGSVPHVEALLRWALRRDPDVDRLGPDLRDRGAFELPVLEVGTEYWVLLDDHAGVLAEARVHDGSMTLYVDGSPDALLDLTVDVNPGTFISPHDLTLTDVAFKQAAEWSQRVSDLLREGGWGPVLAQARDLELDWIVEHDAAGDPIGLQVLTGGGDVAFSSRFGWNVGDLDLPRGFTPDALRAAVAVAHAQA